MYRPSNRGETRLEAASRPRAAATVALPIGALYLLWRTSTLGSGWFLALSVIVFVLEVWSWAELVLLSVQAWRIPPGPARTADERDRQPVDLVIDSHGAEVDELERTLIAARTVRSRRRIVVVDAEQRYIHRKLAVDVGADYVVDPELRTAPGPAMHRASDGPLYAWLTAGQLPMPDLVEAVVPRFDDDRLAVCQLATNVLNHDDLAHLGRDRDDGALVAHVVGPALSRWGAAPWFGPASVVRRVPIDEAGGYPDDASIETLAARLHGAGWSTAFERRRLVASTIPESMERYLGERRRRAARSLRLLASVDGPLRSSAMGRGQRVAHLATAVRLTSSLRLLIAAIVIMVVLLTGRFPVDAPVASLVPFWGAAFLTGTLARRALARGAMRPGDHLRQGWRVVGAEVAAVGDALRRVDHDPRAEPDDRASSGLRALAELPLLDAVALLLDIVLLLRAATLLDHDLLPRLPTAQRVVVFGFTLLFLAPLFQVLHAAALRRQRRAHYRIPAVLEAALDGSPAVTVDVTPKGAGILLSVAPPIGTVTSLEISIPGSDGVIRRIIGTAVVRSARRERHGQWRVGLELTELVGAAREALVTFCAEAPDDGLVEVEAEVSDTAPSPVRAGPRSARAMTATAGAAGLAGLLFGPGVASAEVGDPGAVDRVCVVDPEGATVPGVAVDRLVEEDARPLGVTDNSGCLDVAVDPASVGFVLDYRGDRHEVAPDDYVGDLVRVSLVEWRARVVDLDADPVDGVAIRWFTDRWVPGTPVDGLPDTSRFVGLPVDPERPRQVEISLGPDRFVRPVEGSAVTVVLARVRLTDEAEGVAIDRGFGWEPLIDGTDLVPGRVAVRLDDGTVLRIEVPEAAELVLPAGTIVPQTVELPDTGTSTTLPPATDPEPSTTMGAPDPGSSTSVEPTPTASTSTSISISTTSGSSTTSPSTTPAPDSSSAVSSSGTTGAGP